MKPRTLTQLAVAVSLAFSVTAASAQQLKVATGSPEGTYSQMFKEMNDKCAEVLPTIEVNTSGSLENITNLLGNQVNAGFVQTDVLYFKGNTEDLSNVKTLIALHPEEVHFVARQESGIKQGGFAGVGGKPVVFQTINDLSGYKVGAVGGSFISAQVIRLQAEIQYQTVQFDSNKDLLAALQAGQIQAAVLVGGAPLGAVSELDRNYKLLTIPESTAAKLKGVYRTARVSYPKMNMNGIPTIATDALLVTREYKTEKYVMGLSKFRSCVLNNLDELKETTGTHPKWQSVDPSNKGKWAYYELPTRK